MNKLRRLAEDLVTRHPTLFTGDFDKNKLALSQVTVIRTRSLRNQLAGAITKIVHERGSPETTEKEAASGEGESLQSREFATIEERARVEGTTLPKQDTGTGDPKRELVPEETAGTENAGDSENQVAENRPVVQ